MQAQRHGGEAAGEIAQDRAEPLGRHHDIDGKIDFGLQPAEQALDGGAQAIDAFGHPPRLGQDSAAGIGEHRLAAALAIEQRHAKLGFEIGDAIADHRNGAVEPAGGAGKTLRFDDRQEDAQLFEGRQAGIGRHSKILNISADIFRIFPTKQAPYIGCNALALQEKQDDRTSSLRQPWRCQPWLA